MPVARRHLAGLTLGGERPLQGGREGLREEINRPPSPCPMSRMRPRCSARSAKAVTVEVNDLVEVTEISGPAWR